MVRSSRTSSNHCVMPRTRLVVEVHMSTGSFRTVSNHCVALRTLSTRLVGEVLISSEWLDAPEPFRTTV